MNYEPVIGLEVHVQLATASKLFCGCPAAFGAPPNSQVCPVCLGLPGVLPVFNQRAFEWGIKAALAFDCQLATVMKFDRKQYFYPDLPKNFQISQYDQPLAHRGHLDIVVNEAPRRIRLHRIHLEEDAGKLLHDPDKAASYVDFNRTGIPLLEIVSEPDLRSSEEAFQYLVELKAVLRYLDVSTCNMEEGSLRCDANISVRLPGAATLGEKVEIKNLNSFKAVKAALDFEIRRQSAALQAGQRIAQETRLWNAKAQTTEAMRSKEGASDYRYFPEPDLVPFVIDESVVTRMASELPELPAQRQKRFTTQYGLSAYDAHVLTQSRRLAELFEHVVAAYENPKPVANWLMGDLRAYLNVRNLDPDAVTLQPAWLVHLLEAIDRGTISGTMAKDLFVESLEHQRDPHELIQERGARQIVDGVLLEQFADEALARYPQAVTDYRKGKANSLMFLLGKSMALSKGQANPTQLMDILKRKLNGQQEATR